MHASLDTDRSVLKRRKANVCEPHMHRGALSAPRHRVRACAARCSCRRYASSGTIPFRRTLATRASLFWPTSVPCWMQNIVSARRMLATSCL